MTKLPDIFEVASENSDKAHIRMKKHYNAKRRDVEYSANDKVWLENRVQSSAAEGIAAKLAPKYTGPYVISSRLGSNTYELKDVMGFSGKR